MLFFSVLFVALYQRTLCFILNNINITSPKTKPFLGELNTTRITAHEYPPVTVSNYTAVANYYRCRNNAALDPRRGTGLRRSVPLHLRSAITLLWNMTNK